MNHYIVSNYKEAIKGISLLSKAAEGRAQFFVLDSFNEDAAHLDQADKIQKNKHVPFENGAIPALNVIEVDDHYRPLCNHLLRNVYLVDDSGDFALNEALVPEGITLLGKSGKFNKSKFMVSGGSVGLFEGKRIGRAKNLEALLKVIKLIEVEVNKQKKQDAVLKEKLIGLRSSDKTPEIRQKQIEINALNKELVTVQTRREQSQNFIANSHSRKVAIKLKVNALNEAAIVIKPKLSELKEQKTLNEKQLAGKQLAFNVMNDGYSIKSNGYNQENIRFHQQQKQSFGPHKRSWIQGISKRKP